MKRPLNRSKDYAGAGRSYSVARSLRKPRTRERSILAAIVDATDDAILSKTLDGTITSWNTAAEQMFGYTAREIIGEHSSSLYPSERLQEEEEILDRLSRGIQTRHFETVRLRKDGTAIDVSVTISPIKDRSGNIVAASSILRDISDRKHAEGQLKDSFDVIAQQNETLAAQREALLETNDRLADAVVRLEPLAITDGLTGLMNHRAFYERLREEYDRAVRYCYPLSVILLDVDRFKHYNDTYGHPAGDAILVQIAGVLKREARGTDIVARYGGEEFVIILAQTDADAARNLADRLRVAIAATPWANYGVTASFGVSTLSAATPNVASMVSDADKAMYRSKYRGRNLVTHWADLSEVDLVEVCMLNSLADLVQKSAITNYEPGLYVTEQLKDLLLLTYEATIASWSQILELRDKETEGHTNRVAEMMARLARHLGMSATEVRFAKWGACVHDIGKLTIPDQILHKPGPLTDEERTIMQHHTTIAYELLLQNRFLGPAVDIPYCHHEKWDGTGYPRGLAGEDIPVAARLFAVIDVFDALTSNRPYRSAWPEDEAIAYIRSQSGTHFDPRAVDAFLVNR